MKIATPHTIVDAHTGLGIVEHPTTGHIEVVGFTSVNQERKSTFERLLSIWKYGLSSQWSEEEESEIKTEKLPRYPELKHLR